MFFSKDVLRLKQKMEVLEICDKDCFVIANRQNLNSFWSRSMTLTKYGVMWLKNGNMFFAPIKKASSIISKGVMDYKQAIEIKKEEVELIDEHNGPISKGATSILVYWINIKYKNDRSERYGFTADFMNHAKFILDKFTSQN